MVAAGGLCGGPIIEPVAFASFSAVRGLSSRAIVSMCGSISWASLVKGTALLINRGSDTGLIGEEESSAAWSSKPLSPRSTDLEYSVASELEVISIISLTLIVA